jgi:transposase
LITRLKLIKRQMSGRASFDRLRQQGSRMSLEPTAD